MLFRSIAGMVHAIVLFLVLVALMPYAALIPMPTIAAILFVVAYNMSEWRAFSELLKSSPKSDILVLVVSFVLTVVFDLVVAIEVGVIMAAFLFMKRMADVADVQGWKYYDDDSGDKYHNDLEHIRFKKVPKHTVVYEINGPMFFGASDKIMNISLETGVRVVILRMRSVPAVDISAIQSLQKVLKACRKKDIQLILSHVQEQPLKAMQKAGFDKQLGKDNFCSNIDEALALSGTTNKQ